MKEYVFIIRIANTEIYYTGTKFSKDGEPNRIFQKAPSFQEAEYILVESWRQKGWDIECIPAF